MSECVGAGDAWEGKPGMKGLDVTELGVKGGGKKGKRTGWLRIGREEAGEEEGDTGGARE